MDHIKESISEHKYKCKKAFDIVCVASCEKRKAPIRRTDGRTDKVIERGHFKLKYQCVDDFWTPPVRLLVVGWLVGPSVKISLIMFSSTAYSHTIYNDTSFECIIQKAIFPSKPRQN